MGPQSRGGPRAAGYRFRCGGWVYGHTLPGMSAVKAGGLGPFMGRDRELEALRAAHALVRRGHGTAVVLTGEPGMGKTRLIEEFARECSAGGTRVCSSAGHPARSGVPYSVWELLLAAIDGVGTETPASDLRPWSSHLASERQDQHAVFAAVASRLLAATHSKPHVVAIDDLHWADPSSIAVLQYLLSHVQEAALLVLIGCRSPIPRHPEGLSQTLAMASTVPGAARLDLEGLDVAAIRAMAPAAAAPDENEIRALVARTGGNPLFAQELLRGGSLARQTDTADDSSVPSTITDVVRSRLADLAPAARSVVNAAAAVRRPVELDLLVEICVGGRQLLEAVSEAVDAAFFVELPPARVAFAQPIVSDAVYAGMSIVERSELHLRIAAALEARGAPPTEVAFHFCGSPGLVDPALATAKAEAAGDLAHRQRAFADAAHWYQRAVDLAPIGAEDARPPILLKLGEAGRMAGDVARARETLTEAANLARATGDNATLVRAVLAMSLTPAMGVPKDTELRLVEDALAVTADDDHASRAQLFSRMAHSLHYPGAEERRGAAAEEALVQARRARDPQVLADALFARRALLMDPDGLEERSALSETLVELAEQTGADELRVQARTARAYDRLEGGDVLGAFDELRRLEAHVTSRGLSHHRWRVVLHHALRLAWEGPVEQLQHHADDVGRLARPVLGPGADLVALTLRVADWRIRGAWGAWAEAAAPDGRLPGYIAHGSRAMAFAHAGRLDEARRELVRAGNPMSLPRDESWLGIMAAFGDAAALVGDIDLSRDLYENLRPYGGRMIVHGRWVGLCGGAVDQILGFLAAAIGRPDESEAHFDAAEADYRASGGRAMLVLLNNDRADAVAARDPDRAAHLREQARASLALVLPSGGRSEPLSYTPSRTPLTPREEEILALVARGMANKHIALALRMGEKTVRNHLTSVFAKLGVTDRTQAALLVARGPGQMS